MKIVVSGATGFVGQRLLMELIRRGDQVIALVRDPQRQGPQLPCESVGWDDFESALSGSDAVIHLAGHPVADERWTSEVKKKILHSRIDPSRKLVQAIARLPQERRPKVFLAASAIGYYGDRGNEGLSEASSPGSSFLSSVVQDWEAETKVASSMGLREVRLRIGVVLGRGGGALSKMKPVVLGNGQQWISWIHIDDLVRFIVYTLDRPQVKGIFNLTAPQPVTNEFFTRAFAKVLGMKPMLKVPAIVVRTMLGERAAIVLASTRVLPEATVRSGFSFRFPDVESALEEIYENQKFGEERFASYQFVRCPVEEVFQFFGRAENLERITPPWLNFKILSKTTPIVQSGTLIDYRLKIHGLPVLWQTKIDAWKPNEMFIDTQLKGPYKRWHHTHRFESVPGGTLVVDDIVYKVPMGRLGGIVAGHWVRKDVHTIFSYRHQVISKVFGPLRFES